MSGARLSDDLEALLAEPLPTAASRARDALAALTGREGGPFVLFGAGNLGRRVLGSLRGLGAEVLAFSDNHAGSWGKVVDGVPVLAPQEAARCHPDATFVVTIWGAGHRHRYPNTRAQLASLGVRRIAPVGAVFWRHPEVFLPYFAMDLPQRLLAQKSLVQEAFDLLEDEASRNEYLAQVRWRLRLDYVELMLPSLPERQYFEPEIFSPRTDEVFVDCGAYTGDTLDGFRTFSGDRFESAWLFEPDNQNFARLQDHLGTLPPAVRAKVRTQYAAVGATRGRATMDATGTAASSLGPGRHEVDVVALDDVAFGQAPTFLKMDIEGAELDALAGARKTLAEHAPLSAICAYHRQDHLVQIPLLLRALLPNHGLFLRSYSEECFDLVCYAVPRSRRRDA